MTTAKMPNIKKYGVVFVGLLYTLGLASCENILQFPDTTPTSNSLPDPHNHARYPHQGKSGFLDGTNDATEILFQEPPPGSIIEVSIFNDTQSHQALQVLEPNPFDPGGSSYHFGIYVKEVASNVYFKIQGMHMPYRPVIGFSWVGSNYLVFDITSNPSYGFHYVFDIEAMEFIFVTPMTNDDF